ncbi:hypothetical protein T484DRAFT_3328115 [Baffinella frigidus]|nr:hypothetical protein T484DRAFT_3328115 [Cryptophyta sp. CCMP2293]
MPKLEMAFFSNNRIAKLPEGMEQLTSLRGLFLDGNQLQELPEGFTGMTNLRELTLANNLLKGVPEDLTKLSSLTELYLNGACGNRTVVIPEPVARMGCLKDCYEGQI